MTERAAEIIGDVGDAAPWADLAIDLSDCSRLEISVALYEHERAGLRPDTWPPAVRAKVEKVIEQWLEKNTKREPRAVTYGIARELGKLPCCIIVLHHAEKRS